MVRCLQCDTVNETGASTCVKCQRELARACAQCGAGNPLLARFCSGCGGRLDSVEESQAPPSLGKPERRQISVLFCDLVGSTQLSRSLDPEDWHRLVHRLHSRCGEIIGEHHGHVAQYLGDGILAYFGYPIAAKDDAERAIAAGIDLIQRARDIEPTLPDGLSLRVGITTGSVVIGNVGSSRRPESLALGETLNFAARIQEVAPHNSVLVSADTYRLAQNRFRAETFGPVALKGFSEPFTLHKIVDAGDPSLGRKAAPTPLVGRTRELAAMMEAWNLVASGGAAALLLVGEPGIGKSRLLEVLRDELPPRSVRTLELRCSQHARSSAFHPSIEYLRRSLGLHHGGTAEEIVARLSPLLAAAGLSTDQIALVATLFGVRLPSVQDLAPQAVRPALIDALCRWLAGAEQTLPTLLTIEDLHWADPSTLQLLQTLVDGPAAKSLLVVLTARPEFRASWTSAERVKTVSLGRFDAEDTRRMIELVAGGAELPASTVDELAARAEGIPLFLEEMTKASLGVATRGDAATRREVAAQAAIPASLQGTLMGRLDQLGHNKPLAQLASVLGRDFNQSLLASVWKRIGSLPAIDLGQGLDRVAGAELITRRADGGEISYQFKHALFQDAAYQSLLRSARREYHQCTAEVLREEFAPLVELRPELVAHHYAAAEAHDHAMTFWNRAAQLSVTNSAYNEAITQFEEALGSLLQLAESSDRSRKELDLRISQGGALIATQGYASSKVEKTYSRAAELCDELGSDLPPRVVYGVWVGNFVRGDLASSRLMVPNLERLAQQPDPASALVALAALASWAFWQGDYERLGEHHASAQKLYAFEKLKQQHEQLLRDHGFEGLLYPQLYYAWSRIVVGDAAGGLETWKDAVTLSTRINDPYVTCEVLAFGAAIHHDLGDFRTAGELAERVREIAAAKGFLFWLAIALGHRGLALVAAGDAATGIAMIKEGLQIFTNVGVKTPYSYYLCYLAEAYLVTGRVQEAHEVLTEALAMSRSNVDKNYEPEMLRLAGEAFLAEGKLAVARDHLVASLEMARAQNAKLFELRSATSLARLECSQGNPASAKQLLSGVRSAFGNAPEFGPLDVADRLLREL
jgi:class 3 adenylate cyclase/tetratricopeptide (TPR) repeat protein